MVTEAEQAYAAGIFDGEGHVGIVVTKNGRGEVYHRLMLNVTNTNAEIIQWLFDRWDGCIHSPRYFAKEEWREANRWTVSDKRAMKFLTDVLPFLIIKKEQAEIGISFQQTKGRGGFGTPAPDLTSREAMRKQISSLNQGGSP
jgi:hypothetical protein